jgi:aryl-alcohol dehydrogenase-like predicted oxidoreductase
VEERRSGPWSASAPGGTFDGDLATARAVVDAAFEAGVRLFDTSPMYGAAEQTLGAASAPVATRRSSRRRSGRTTRPRRCRQYDDQLEWFGGRIDIEQVHNLVAWHEHLPWLERERDAGRVVRLGVTHYSSSAFGELVRALRTGRFDAVQLPYNPADRACERELLPVAAELGISGDRDGAARRRPARPLAAPGRGARASRPFGVETWAQALLKWVLSDDRIDVAIPGRAAPTGHARTR